MNSTNSHILAVYLLQRHSGGRRVPNGTNHRAAKGPSPLRQATSAHQVVLDNIYNQSQATYAYLVESLGLLRPTPRRPTP
jgi:hypothetical protein